MSLVGFKAKNHTQQVAKRGADDDTDDRGTEQEFVDGVAQRLGIEFDLDVAAAPHNTKCERFYDRHQDGREQEWNGNIWCNPPYSGLKIWLQKAWIEWDAGRARTIVMLLPANRVEQKWWQEFVEPFRDRPGSPLRVEFLPGRMRFDRPNAVISPKGDRPPFGCCLLIWQAR